MREAAALCLNELFKYRAAVKQEIGTACLNSHTSESSLKFDHKCYDYCFVAVVNMWTKVTIDHLTTLCVNSHIPSYYLSCLQTVSRPFICTRLYVRVHTIMLTCTYTVEILSVFEGSMQKSW